MKKNILIIASFFTTFAYAMEKISLVSITNNSLSLLYNGTTINLSKGSVCDIEHKVDYIILGSHQQELLSGKFDTYSTVGTLYNSYDEPSDKYSNGQQVHGPTVSIYTKNSNDDSASDDDTYKPYPYHPDDEKQKLWENTYQKTKSHIYNVVEPCINTSMEGFIYNVCRKNPNYHPRFVGYNGGGNIYINDHNNSETIMLQFTGDKAIQEASKDLGVCYREILKILANYYSSASDPEAKYIRLLSHPNISITIPTLSVDVGFPRDIAAPIAIATIFDFLQEYPEGYNNINLVVKKRSDLALYKKLLMEYYKPIKAICLLRWAYKNKDISFSYVPCEMIDSITWLMFNS